MIKDDFDSLLEFMTKVPSVDRAIGFGETDGIWWIKFKIDVKHDLAWQVVQEMGHVVNYLSTEQRLPTVFYPVSPPPYANGGPEEFLSWVIETENPEFLPDTLMQWLKSRFPNPVDDLSQWEMD